MKPAALYRSFFIISSPAFHGVNPVAKPKKPMTDRSLPFFTKAPPQACMFLPAGAGQ
jgi:hypothetical protein